MNRLTFDPAAIINSITWLQDILIGLFAVLGVWTLGVVALMLIVKAVK